MIGLGLGGIAFWIIANYGKAFTALYQLISISMLAVAMFILIRYRLTVFCLRIEGKNGTAVDVSSAMPEEPDFVVERMRGKTTVALARMSLDCLRRAEVVKYDRLRDAVSGATVYKYQADMAPDEGCLLVFSLDGSKVAIFTDMPPEMFNFLKKTACENADIE